MALHRWERDRDTIVALASGSIIGRVEGYWHEEAQLSWCGMGSVAVCLVARRFVGIGVGQRTIWAAYDLAGSFYVRVFEAWIEDECWRVLTAFAWIGRLEISFVHMAYDWVGSVHFLCAYRGVWCGCWVVHWVGAVFFTDCSH